MLFRYTGQGAPDQGKDRHVIEVSRLAANNAMRSGDLPVELPDGTRYTLRVEREEQAPTGDWTMVAQIDTALGRQSAVITYGSDGVFGVLPTPDGNLLQISTSDGETVIEPAGSMVPENLSPSEAAAAEYLPSLQRAGTAFGTMSDQKALSIASSGDVEIDLLGVYTSDLVSLRGSVAAAESEFTNQVAIANQAFRDSGASARLRLVGLRETDFPPSTSNLDALFAITENKVPDGLDLHQLRDTLAADLVAMLRPNRPTHGSCGVAWLNGANLWPLSANPDFGFSVINVENCGPFVLAHEAGHNLGSHHDIESAVDTSGTVGRGAFIYSYGYRQDDAPAFATVMAFAVRSQKWLGWFSHPDTTNCEGVACGVAEQADNVRSLNQMAPRAARFRDPSGTISVLDATIAEGDDGTRTMSFVVRLSSPAPAGGVHFDVATADGTAGAGSDYLARSSAGQLIPEGERTYTFDVEIFGDPEEEPDETFMVNLGNVIGAEVFTGQATGTLRNDDPEVTISGQVRFGEGTTPPVQPIYLQFEINDGYGLEYQQFTVSPPDFRFALSVAKGIRVAASVVSPPPPLAELTVDWGMIDADVTRDITLQRKPVLSGRVVLPRDTVTLPEYLIVEASGINGDPLRGIGIVVFPPDFRFETEVKPGAQVQLQLAASSLPAPFLPPASVDLGEVTRDTVRDITVERGVTVSGRIRFPLGVDPPNELIVVSLFRTDAAGGGSDYAYPPDFHFSAVVPPGGRYTLNAFTAAAFGTFARDMGTIDADLELDIPLQPVPRLSIADATVFEGQPGTTMADFVLSLDSPSPGGVTIALSTQSGSAIAGKDYQPQAATLHFAKGETSKVFSVPVLGNTSTEPDRVFLVNVDFLVGATTLARQAAGVIRDDDGATIEPVLWMTDVAKPEGDRDQSKAVFEVRLSRNAPSGGVSFNIVPTDGTALTGSDYLMATPSALTIAEGRSSANVGMWILGDLEVEPDETFTVNLDSVVGAVVVKGRATATIVNDDIFLPPVTASDHYAVARDGSLAIGSTIGVLANDRHAFMNKLGAYQVLGNPPRHGQLGLQRDGALNYTPDTGFVGRDGFVYNACVPGACTPARVEFSVGFELSADDQYLWMLPPADNGQQQGFVRLTNREDRPGLVSVWGVDATGRRSDGTISMTLDPRESRQFNSQDAERGNPAKGLSGSLGKGSGNWFLVVRSDLDLEALAYIRTPDGFLTSMHDRVEGDGVDWSVPMFNPAENVNQASRLRLINTSMDPVGVQIHGVDDTGEPALEPVTTILPPLAARELDSTDLENGNADKVLAGRLGDGRGKWQLRVSATDRITVQSLLSSPKGYLTNLSTHADTARQATGERVLWMVPPASNVQQQGFVRLTNLEDRSGRVLVWGVDDSGRRSGGTLDFTLNANESKQLNSQDLEFGNAAKGVAGGLGSGEGNWRLFVLTDLELKPMGLIRTPDGFLTTIHDTVSTQGLTWRVPIFNPASNTDQQSILRIVNPNNAAVSLVIEGMDDTGQPAPGGSVSITLAAHTAVELSAQDLESGDAGKGLTGRLGNGTGKWVLTVDASAPVKLLNLLRDPQGILTNLSGGTQGTAAELDP